MEDEQGPDDDVKVFIDYAPTEVFEEVFGPEATLRAAEQYARDTATRHLPMNSLFADKVKDDKGDDISTLVIGIALVTAVTIGFFLAFLTIKRNK